LCCPTAFFTSFLLKKCEKVCHIANFLYFCSVNPQFEGKGTKKIPKSVIKKQKKVENNKI